MSACSELESRFHRLYALRNAAGVLQSDMATRMLPGGAAARAEQSAALQVVCHGVLADPADLFGPVSDETQCAHINLRALRSLDNAIKELV